ncbi:D-aminoacyl-tRNA deacylase [Ochrovirga pacifica]|uniref:D-aminoacyl-tRNA deacylase n=1 Tax=Ochrovirga pacifica TaxID=1042376 RepID=UPI0002559D62|nr:D-aminoacyl-tRNA deacylase [Ochrovirga pacifica]
MRVVLQRVSKGAVSIDGKKVAQIGAGLVIFLGIVAEDGQEDLEWLCQKIVKQRIFSDENGLMNLSIQDIKGEVIVVSQFTLFAQTKKGNRPSFIKAAKPDIAIPLYEAFKKRMSELMEQPVQSGEFGAYMEVNIVNDGPITILMDTHQKE